MDYASSINKIVQNINVVMMNNWDLKACEIFSGSVEDETVGRSTTDASTPVIQEVEPDDMRSGKKHVLSRRNDSDSERTPGVPTRGAHSSGGAAFHVPRRGYHLCYRIPVHYRAQGEWTQPIHWTYVAQRHW